MFFTNLYEKLFYLEYIMGQGELLFLTFFKAMFSGFKKNFHGLMEILTLRLVEGCIVPCYNHLAQGD